MWGLARLNIRPALPPSHASIEDEKLQGVASPGGSGLRNRRRRGLNLSTAGGKSSALETNELVQKGVAVWDALEHAARRSLGSWSGSNVWLALCALDRAEGWKRPLLADLFKRAALDAQTDKTTWHAARIAKVFASLGRSDVRDGETARHLASLMLPGLGKDLVPTQNLGEVWKAASRLLSPGPFTTAFVAQFLIASRLLLPFEMQEEFLTCISFPSSHRCIEMPFKAPTLPAGFPPDVKAAESAPATNFFVTGETGDGSYALGAARVRVGRGSSLVTAASPQAPPEGKGGMESRAVSDRQAQVKVEALLDILLNSRALDSQDACSRNVELLPLSIDAIRFFLRALKSFVIPQPQRHLPVPSTKHNDPASSSAVPACETNAKEVCPDSTGEARSAPEAANACPLPLENASVKYYGSDLRSSRSSLSFLSTALDISMRSMPETVLGPVVPWSASSVSDLDNESSMRRLVGLVRVVGAHAPQCPVELRRFVELSIAASAATSQASDLVAIVPPLLSIAPLKPRTRRRLARAFDRVLTSGINLSELEQTKRDTERRIRDDKRHIVKRKPDEKLEQVEQPPKMKKRLQATQTRILEILPFLDMLSIFQELPALLQHRLFNSLDEETRQAMRPPIPLPDRRVSESRPLLKERLARVLQETPPPPHRGSLDVFAVPETYDREADSQVEEDREASGLPAIETFSRLVRSS
eukprot:GHVT01027811.1.p1 GENE.GHVT01027811.1~~GHVT01027811.1.p1  ORF type:complete len:703 (-),score=90.87 GHVT01027811.1:399-2507(-)